MVMRLFKKLAQAISLVVDADDCKVIGVVFVVVAVASLLLIFLAGALGLAMSLFDLARSL